jgi:hypothetical protein
LERRYIIVRAGRDGKYYGDGSTLSCSWQYATASRISSWASDGAGTTSYGWTSTRNDTWHAWRTSGYARWTYGQWNTTWSRYSCSRWSCSECARHGTLRTASTDVPATSGNTFPEPCDAPATTAYGTAETKTSTKCHAPATTAAAAAATWRYDDCTKWTADQSSPIRPDESTK